MKKVLLFFIGALIIILLSGFFWWQQNLKAVNSSDTGVKTIVVPQGNSLRVIAQNLEKEKLIKNWFAFFLLVKKMGLQTKIQAGEFQISPSFSANRIIEELQHGTIDISVTIPEGWRNAEIAQTLNEKMGLSKDEFLSKAKEGFMFPDTYYFPQGSSVEKVIDIMQDNFNKRIKSINSDSLIQGKIFSGLTLNEVIIISSIVEREAKYDIDRPIIAGIIIKRLKKDWPLEVDATLQYVLGYQKNEKTWWKKELTADDLLLSSPYNLRKNKGLPPGPISNPGLAAIKSVLNPVSTNYWFYLSDKSGKMHYAKTLEEHELNIDKFL